MSFLLPIPHLANLNLLEIAFCFAFSYFPNILLVCFCLTRFASLPHKLASRFLDSQCLAFFLNYTAYITCSYQTLRAYEIT